MNMNTIMTAVAEIDVPVPLNASNVLDTGVPTITLFSVSTPACLHVIGC